MTDWDAKARALCHGLVEMDYTDEDGPSAVIDTPRIAAALRAAYREGLKRAAEMCRERVLTEAAFASERWVPKYASAILAAIEREAGQP